MPNPNEPMSAYASRLAKGFGADAPAPSEGEPVRGLFTEIRDQMYGKRSATAPSEVLEAVRLMTAEQRGELAELLGIPRRSELLWLADAEGKAVAPSLRSG